VLASWARSAAGCRARFVVGCQVADVDRGDRPVAGGGGGCRPAVRTVRALLDTLVPAAWKHVIGPVSGHPGSVVKWLAGYGGQLALVDVEGRAAQGEASAMLRASRRSPASGC
jgi:hypothetical protein